MFTQRRQATLDSRRKPVGTCSDATPPRGPPEFGRDKIRELTAVCEAQGVRLTGGRIGRKIPLGVLSRGHEIASVDRPADAECVRMDSVMHEGELALAADE